MFANPKAWPGFLFLFLLLGDVRWCVTHGQGVLGPVPQEAGSCHNLGSHDIEF